MVVRLLLLSFRGGVHIFSGSNFAPVDNYQINVGSAIAAPAFSSTSCCSASVWHDSIKDRTVLKIIRVLPPAVPSSQAKANSSTWERAIAKKFWWSLLVGLDWWDVVGCTRSAAKDGIVSLNSVIVVLDANFDSLSSTQHRQRFGPSLDRIKCRLLEGTNAQEVGAMVLHKQTSLLNPSALVPEPWQASGETLSGIDPEATAVEAALVPHIQNKPRPRGADASQSATTNKWGYGVTAVAFDPTRGNDNTVSPRKKKQKENVIVPSNKRRKENVITLPKKKQKMNLATTSPIVNAAIVLDQLSCDIQTPETNILPQRKQFKSPIYGVGD